MGWGPASQGRQGPRSCTSPVRGAGGTGWWRGGVLRQGRDRDREALTALGAVNRQRLFLLLLEGVLGRERAVRAVCSRRCCPPRSPRPAPHPVPPYIVLVPHGIELLQLLGPIPGLLLGDICKGKDPH